MQIACAVWGAINPKGSFESPAPPQPCAQAMAELQAGGHMGTGVSDAGVPGDSPMALTGDKAAVSACSTESHWAQQLQRDCCEKLPQVLSLTPSLAQQRTDADTKRVVSTDLAGWSFTDTSPRQHLLLRGWKGLQGVRGCGGSSQALTSCTEHGWLCHPQLSQHMKYYPPLCPPYLTGSGKF